MSGGGKGGKSTTEVKIPAWLEKGARQNMARANELAQIGYVPYFGPDVAAFTPMQQAAFQNTGDATSAFGMATPSNPMAGMPQAMTFADGTTGYSSAPMYEQSLAALAAARPGQFAALQAPFIDPITGADPASPFGNGSAPQMPQMPMAGAAAPMVGGGSSGGGGGGGSFGGFQPARSSGGGGFTSIRDMFDGGGPGRSGSTFSGGVMSAALNRAGVSPVAGRATQAPAARVATNFSSPSGSRVGRPRGGR